VSTILEVTGGTALHGTIVPQGAKNEALQVIAATLLTEEPVTIYNIPDIADVNLMIEILHDLGLTFSGMTATVVHFGQGPSILIT